MQWYNNHYQPQWSKRDIMTTVLENWEDQPLMGERAATAIRPIRPSDLKLVYEMHQRLSPESIYYRYLQYRTPAWEELATICHLPPETGEALVATLNGDAERIIGLAYYVRERATYLPTAELGILVEDLFQGQGIGRQLWQRLHRSAEAKRIRQLRVLSEPGNRRIRRLIEGSGYPYRASIEDDLHEFMVFLDEQPQRTQAMQRLSQMGRLILQQISASKRSKSLPM